MSADGSVRSDRVTRLFLPEESLMRSRLVRPVLLALAGVGVCFAAPLAAQDTKDKDLPKAAEILEKYVKATGGKAAYEKVKSRIMKGTMSVAGQTGKLTIYQKAPN